MSQTDLNVKQLRNRTIAVSLPRIPPKAKSVHIDKLLAENKTPNLGFMTPNNTVTYTELSVSSELDTDQGEGTRDQLRLLKSN